MEAECKWNSSANGTRVLNAWKKGVIGSLQKKYSHGP